MIQKPVHLDLEVIMWQWIERPFEGFLGKLSATVVTFCLISVWMIFAIILSSLLAGNSHNYAYCTVEGQFHLLALIVLTTPLYTVLSVMPAWIIAAANLTDKGRRIGWVLNLALLVPLDVVFHLFLINTEIAVFLLALPLSFMCFLLYLKLGGTSRSAYSHMGALCWRLALDASVLLTWGFVNWVILMIIASTDPTFNFCY